MSETKTLKGLQKIAQRAGVGRIKCLELIRAGKIIAKKEDPTMDTSAWISTVDIVDECMRRYIEEKG